MIKYPFSKKELIKLLAEYYNKPKSYFSKDPTDALIYLWEEEVLPDIKESSR